MPVKLVVMYPYPTDVEAFQRLYNRDHVPLAVKKLAGKTKVVATKVLASPDGQPAFYLIAEIHFPTMQALEDCTNSEGGRQTLAHAVSISSGGLPTVLIAEDETVEFAESAQASF